jgi:hypothetical protein
MDLQVRQFPLLLAPVLKNYGMFHDFASHPCAQAELILRFSYNFIICTAETNTVKIWMRVYP